MGKQVNPENEHYSQTFLLLWRQIQGIRMIRCRVSKTSTADHIYTTFSTSGLCSVTREALHFTEDHFMKRHSAWKRKIYLAECLFDILSKLSL